MPSVNLAPGTQHLVIVRRRQVRLYSIAGGLVGLALLIWGGIFLYVQFLEGQQQEAQEQLQAVDLKIATIEEDAQRVLLFEERLKALDTLLEHHITWNPV
ncbi:MAG: hypothetical protein ACRD4B_09115, partial [Acidobacteriota bacterium]